LTVLGAGGYYRCTMTKKITTFITILVTLMSLAGVHPVIAESPPVLITEVQTGLIDANGSEFPLQEFIELTNTSAQPVNLTGWKLEYLSAANDGSGAPTQVIDTLNGQISSGGHGIWEHDGYFPIAPDGIFGVGDVSTSGFLAKSGGHIRLTNGTSMVDCVSWGSAVTINGCDKVSAVATAGYTIQRQPVNNTYIKSNGVSNVKPASPQGNNIYSVPTDPPVLVPPINPPPGNNCEGVQLSEILANPAGDDGQGEYIELYNPANSDQTLYGCSLQLSNGKQYIFKSTDVLTEHQYLAFPYAVTALQLSNSGASITLITASGQITTTYPAVGDDEAWALVGGIWSTTSHPTPNLANTSSTKDTPDTETTDSLLIEVGPCPAGKYRNPTTNRCRNISLLDEAPTACVIGQERNPSTGRCRKIATASTQVACQPSQERNPDTGRCRKVETANTQKPCEAGQERNAETGRCRKVQSATRGKVLGATSVSKKTYHYILVATILSCVACYGAYEYRHGFLNLFGKFKRRVTNR